MFLRNVSRKIPEPFKYLLQYGFGDLCSTVHGDLVKEHFKKGCKETVGRFQSR